MHCALSSSYRCKIVGHCDVIGNIEAVHDGQVRGSRSALSVGGLPPMSFRKRRSLGEPCDRLRRRFVTCWSVGWAKWRTASRPPTAQRLVLSTVRGYPITLNQARETEFAVKVASEVAGPPRLPGIRPNHGRGRFCVHAGSSPRHHDFHWQR